jgi:hypothetical protein
VACAKILKQEARRESQERGAKERLKARNEAKRNKTPDRKYPKRPLLGVAQERCCQLSFPMSLFSLALTNIPERVPLVS